MAYLWIDATYANVRDARRTVWLAVMIAVAPTTMTAWWRRYTDVTVAEGSVGIRLLAFTDDIAVHIY